MALINLFFGAAECLFIQRATFLSENGLTPSQIGLVFSIMNLTGTFAPLIGGALADKVFSRYKMYLMSIIGFGLLAFFMPLSAKVRFGGLILSMVFMPMLQFFHPIGSTMIATCSINAVYTVKNVDYSYLRLWMSFGFTVANLSTSPLIDAFGINAPFYGSIVFFIMMFLLRSTIRRSETAPQSEKRTVTASTGGGFRTLFKNYYILSFTILAIIYAAAGNCYSYVNYFLKEHQIDASKIGIVAGIKVIGEILVMLLLPRLKRFLSLSGLQALAGIFLCAELIGMLFVRSLLPLLPIVMLGGIGNGISLSSAGLYVRAMAPRGLEATAQSLWAMGSNLGGIVLSYIFGRIIDTRGVLANYRFGLLLETIWVALFIMTLVVGRYILKKPTACPLFFSRGEARFNETGEARFNETDD